MSERRAVPSWVVLGAVLVAAAAGARLLLPRVPVSPAPPEPTEAPAEIESPPPPAPASASAPPVAPPPAHVRRVPGAEQACPAGMLLADGVYCPFVARRCVDGDDDRSAPGALDHEAARCRRYATDVLCEGRLAAMRFCIDDLEYPNQPGVVPAVMVDWNDARRACSIEGKRLCTVEEWQFACEGPAMWPLPDGLSRAETACNVDAQAAEPDRGRLADRFAVAAEVERLDGRVPAGARERCVSAFAVHDLAGNVAEWVDNRFGKRDAAPHRSGVAGGDFGAGRAGCRALVLAHDDRFRSPRLGFRCCADVARASRMDRAGPPWKNPRP